ncbi:aminoacyl-tRNA deacylase [Aquisphaera insulae]|uniref:aminoacyl-tRNA deacylase n=1 Tax=Aquisphaera insulae TaxID=2712864 RepID=UPI0013EBDE7E|nr:YbaK/EbsC family protein [Aquisphaera insulae]
MYVVDFLRSRRVEFETLLHRPVSSATKLAGSVHVPGRTVAKSVLVGCGDGFLIALLASTTRIDLDRLAAALGRPACDVRLATPGEIEALFANCEPGSIPAFGRLYGLRSIVDEGLAHAGSIVVRGNLRHQDVRMTFADFQQLEEPMLASFSRPIHDPASRPARRRRAG